MSDFEEYIKNKYPEDYAVLSIMYSNQAMEELYPDRFEVWQEQQAKVDELQKENAALVHVIKSRDIQLENEKHEYDELVNKLVDSKMKNTKLQKRVNAALEITKQGIRKQGGDYYLEKLEQALNGGDE